MFTHDSRSGRGCGSTGGGNPTGGLPEESSQRSSVAAKDVPQAWWCKERGPRRKWIPLSETGSSEEECRRVNANRGFKGGLGRPSPRPGVCPCASHALSASPQWRRHAALCSLKSSERFWGAGRQAVGPRGQGRIPKCKPCEPCKLGGEAESPADRRP